MPRVLEASQDEFALIRVWFHAHLVRFPGKPKQYYTLSLLQAAYGLRS